VRYMPHVWGTALTVATNLHLLASLPDQPGGLRQLPPLLELDQSEHPFRAEVVDEAPVAIDGEVAVPTGPGLGVDVDEEWVRAHALPL
jgi:D-galactarolactone cycloisomerase